MGNGTPKGAGELQRRPWEPLKRFEAHVLGRMGSGVLLLIPVLVTLAVVEFFIAGFARLFSPVVSLINDSPYVQELPSWSVWLILVLVICTYLYIMGILIASRVGRRRVLMWQNAVLSRVPVIKTIYNLAHEATEAFTAPSRRHFSRVVFVEWPRSGLMAMGFVTGHSRLGDEGGRLLVVYIPTVPNPTSGNLAFVSEDEVVETEFSVEEAMKTIFSGGIVLPEVLRRADSSQPLESDG